MNRYTKTSTNVTKRYDGKQVFKTTHYPKIPVSIDDQYVFATEADYLDAMAYKYYRDTTHWWILVQANNIKGTLKAPTGQQIRIPANVNTIIANFSRENSFF